MIDHFRGRGAGPAATRSVIRAGVTLAFLLALAPTVCCVPIHRRNRELSGRVNMKGAL